jgi:hypothetical protein
MNPSVGAPIGGMVGSGAMGRGPRDRDIGLTVTIVQGQQKGYVGTIKDVNGTLARVELRTGNKIITIDKSKLRERMYVLFYKSILFRVSWLSNQAEWDIGKTPPQRSWF